MSHEVPAWAIRTAADRRAIEEGCHWDADAAERPILFAEAHLRPKFTSSEFELFEYQKAFVRSLYGWRRPDGSRRFRKAMLHIAKKNGKTLLASLLCNYELFAAGVPSALVVSASTTKHNATQIFSQMVYAIKKNRKLSKLAKPTESEKKIVVKDRDAEFFSMSSDAPGAEGWNISFGIVDEAHAHESPKLYKTLEHGTSGRADGCLVIISTAGEDKTHFYYDLLQKGREIVSGEDDDTTFYAEIYEASDTDALDDPTTWKKANPSLDLYPGFTTENFRLAWESAKKKTQDRLNFMRYRLNIFCRSEDDVYIDLGIWDSLKKTIEEATLRESPCWLGFDASQRIDPTSLSAVWHLGGKFFYVRSWCWIASEGVREREKSNLTKYNGFIADGHMIETDGDMIDKEPVAKKIKELREKYQIKTLVMDPNGAWVFGAELASDGLDVVRMPQNFKHFNDPTKAFLDACMERRVSHDGNSWLRFCINSVRLGSDPQGNVRPVKAKSVDKIDGAVALLMAFSMANQAAAELKPKASPYEERGVFIF